MLGKLPTLSSGGDHSAALFPQWGYRIFSNDRGAKDASPSHSDLNVAWGYICYEARLVKSKVRQGNECHSSRFQSERDGVRILEDGPKATKKMARRLATQNLPRDSTQNVYHLRILDGSLDVGSRNFRNTA